jgi:hypothetical protein
MGGPATECAGQVGDGENGPSLAGHSLDELPIRNLVAGAASSFVPRQHSVVSVKAEHPDHGQVRTDRRAVGERGGRRVVGVKHKRSAVAYLFRDQSFDVNQLV